MRGTKKKNINLNLIMSNHSFTWARVTHSFCHFDTLTKGAVMWNFVSNDSSLNT